MTSRDSVHSNGMCSTRAVPTAGYGKQLTPRDCESVTSSQATQDTSQQFQPRPGMQSPRDRVGMQASRDRGGMQASRDRGGGDARDDDRAGLIDRLNRVVITERAPKGCSGARCVTVDYM